ncbi:MAG: hypothetical protein A3J09_00160 [Candidatus Zambryskibacteria bacterium RIFCSPLOWO2_02_FULL_51_21]|uniref:Thioredoxin domain-containing protein n=1 Tax=Candidatus Zambryskibacteria bacterium RIFCSPHIGHO2_02_FULL_43_37 TaxID=1802749 RepID=A0A1G2THT2_9BACT|nr:MAG: hypothetical protein A2723_00160 [Candidatus Zambryskibacteria bacterium RIFCSPHIGHO2_01_FULL_52_18]OHA96874.1 MAG: hypothetical protein A3D49_02060 [Candidatus Zambryskibacteria bacterium RIFCSPHIGHO2_02_FULL_43_37]OHB07067.1 MAG: hypothetical protein A2944_02295 [Candidatus Zambryskibacteria bacterium RIFCSPLOWO2_01_FULL_52_12]OHB10986.1 MAG: hypothetical protein A3J09_00160 [Candidatus Zambryskibacteria bacterium RIFCSPLOWO2_02_FULL_51_21]
MNKKIIWVIVLLAAVGGLVWLIRTPGKPGELDAFAQCIKDSGAKYYGAFWCPNCKNQEARFGRSAKLLPRIECSTPDGKGQLPVCQEAKIEGYPTWDFPNGTRQTGNLPLETLSELTNCLLPQ